MIRSAKCPWLVSGICCFCLVPTSSSSSGCSFVESSPMLSQGRMHGPHACNSAFQFPGQGDRANGCCCRVFAEMNMLLLKVPDLPMTAFLPLVLCKKRHREHKVSKTWPTLATALEPLDLAVFDGRAVSSFLFSFSFFLFVPPFVCFVFYHLPSRVLIKGQEDGSKGKDSCNQT